MAAGDAASGERVCVVGSRALRDFHAGLCAANLRRAGIDARAVDIELEVDRADENALGLARRFDDPAWRAGFAARLAIKLQADERVGLPAMLGLRDPHGALDRSAAAAGPAGVRDPHAAAVRAGHAPVRDPPERASPRPAGGSCWAPRWSTASGRVRG